MTKPANPGQTYDHADIPKPSEPQRWWAIFPDYRDLSSGVLQNKPWGGGSNMTSDFQVVNADHYDAVVARAEKAEADNIGLMALVSGMDESMDALRADLVAMTEKFERNSIAAGSYSLKLDRWKLVAGKLAEALEKLSVFRKALERIAVCDKVVCGNDEVCCFEVARDALAKFEGMK